jgi:phosphate-selective porin
MTRPYADAIAAKDPADFARIASGKLGEQLGLDEAASAQVRSVMERMAGNAPELFRDKASPIESTMRMLKQGRATEALRQQILMLREIQRTVPLTAEQKKKLQSLRRVFVPLPK